MITIIVHCDTVSSADCAPAEPKPKSRSGGITGRAFAVPRTATGDGFARTETPDGLFEQEAVVAFFRDPDGVGPLCHSHLFIG